MNPRISLLALALAATACTAVPSSDLETAAIEADYTLVVEDDGLVQVEAQLRVAGTVLTFVDLAPDDTLVLDDGRRVAPIDQLSDAFDVITYRTAAPARPGPVHVRLLRQRWASAPESWVVLPPPLRLRASHPDYVVGLDDIPLTWGSDGPGEVLVSVDGACVRDTSWSVPDLGYFVITPDLLEIRRRWAGERCAVDITVERVSEGRLDPRLAAGRITATQRRWTTVDLYR